MQKIIYGIHDCEIGTLVIGLRGDALCWLGWMTDGYKGHGLERMKQFYPHADYAEDTVQTKPMMDKIMQAWKTDTPHSIPMDYDGTEFQKSVWDALLALKKGQTCSYGDIAKAIGKPAAARAVGSAVGENPISLIIPCHRVLPSSGGVGNYGWGPDVKENLLKIEGALDKMVA